jgi:hypothetical protein
MVWEKIMQKYNLLIALAALSVAGPAAAASDSTAQQNLADQASFQAAIRSRNEGALIEASTELEQSETFARSRSDYGLELRPSVSDDDVGLALRINLPDQWNHKRMKEQLILAARSEQLRVASLEWEDIVSVYRDFCTYRMLQKQIAMTAAELRFIEPYLKKADQSVERNQLTVSERARLYSTYLALANDHNEQINEFLDIQRRIRALTGPEADLEKYSAMTVIKMPAQLEIETLLQQALKQRADYRQFNTHLRAMQLAEEAARGEEGFRLKFLQPAYRVNYDDGTDGWEVSASFTLPWGTRNPDIAVYQNQQALDLAAQAQQRKTIEDQLRVTLDMANAYYAQAADQKRRITPVLQLLSKDLELLEGGPLEQIRDLISIRERMLDAALQSAESDCRAETLAIDLAETLGGW